MAKPDPKSCNPEYAYRPLDGEDDKKIKNFEVHGQNFAKGKMTKVDFGRNGVRVKNENAKSDTLITCDVYISSKAKLDGRDVTVTQNKASGSEARAFDVR